MKRSCVNFSCKKYGKECTACSTAGRTKGALCIPTCSICKITIAANYLKI